MADGNVVEGDEAVGFGGAPSDPVILSARLTPYRSLGPRGFLLVMLLVGAMSFVSGAIFWARGAWPVTGFCGLDVLAVWIAFRASYRSARVFEDVRLSAHELVLVRGDRRGATVTMRFNPRWVRLVEERIPDEGVTRLSLVSSGRSTEIGGFLNPADRTSFASALRAALGAAKSGDQIAKPA